ncbi:MAG: cytochrome c biogenesis protein ResB, partial [Dehalococcoidia bacterium]
MSDGSGAQGISPAALARRLWRFLCSVRLALTLILLIAAASLAGALIIQVPGEVLSSPASYDRWVEGLGPRYGPFTGLLTFLGLFRVFSVWWFIALVAMLVLNLAACTINRLPTVWRAVHRPIVKVGPIFFERGRCRSRFSSLPLSRQEASDVVVKALRRRHYRVTTDRTGDDTLVYAERNRYN